MCPPGDIDLTSLLLNNHNEFKCSNFFGNVGFVWFENTFSIKWNKYFLLLGLHIGVYYKGQSID
jgi:hypothetical protein